MRDRAIEKSTMMLIHAIHASSAEKMVKTKAACHANVSDCPTGNAHAARTISEPRLEPIHAISAKSALRNAKPAAAARASALVRLLRRASISSPIGCRTSRYETDLIRLLSIPLRSTLAILPMVVKSVVGSW